MTIPSTPRKAGPLLGTGAQTAWPFTFKVFAESDIQVTIADALGVETALVLNTDYSVALNANQDTSPGGTVTYPISGDPLAVGSVLAIVGDLDYDQPLDLPSGGNFSPIALENELDRLTMQIQQLRATLGRSLLVPVTSDAAPSLPFPEASQLIGWDASGETLQNVPISDLATAVGYGTFRFDTFLGDGVTTQFTLTADPAVLGNIDVSIDGQTYVPGVDHSLVSGALVFAVAPALGAEILARYGQALLISGPVDAAAVSYQPAGVGSEMTDVETKIRQYAVTPQDFFVAGASDWSVAFAAMFATGKPWYIPYLAGGYTISSTQTVAADGICDGYIVPTVSIGAAPVFTISDSGYGRKRSIRGLKVDGSVALRAAGLYGIRVDCPNSHLIDCSAYQLNYGIIVRMYSVTLTKCNAWQCNTNLSAYARSFGQEINALTINGGNYDSAVNVALNIGDTSWGDALAAGNSHGVVINITGGVATDGAENRIDNCSTVNITGIYGETSNTDCIWRLGGSGDGNLANVNISGNFFKNTKYAVRCYSAVKNLTVGPNFLSAITISELKLTSDIYGVNHRKGEYAGCFGNGQTVGVAFRSLGVNSLNFQGYTLEVDGLINGCQNVGDYPTKWYPNAVYTNSGKTVRDMNSTISSGVYYTTPATGKAVTVVSGTTVQFTTISDSYAFNGGDRISLSGGTATYVRSVDYDLGQALLDGGTVGAGTISQTAPYLITQAIMSAAPVSGTWNRGDTVTAFLPAVGSPKGWTCTVAGTPGTWVSQGNL